MAHNNKQVVEKINAAFARNDVEAFLAHCHDDLVWTMVGGETVTGKDAIRKWMAAGPSDPPNFDVETMLADGDFVTAIGNMTMNENGTIVPYAYCDVWRFNGDKVAELKAFVVKTTAATT